MNCGCGGTEPPLGLADKNKVRQCPDLQQQVALSYSDVFDSVSSAVAGRDQCLGSELISSWRENKSLSPSRANRILTETERERNGHCARQM